ncbi:MAG: hypothetical protein AB7O43_16695 [Hyphomicrobiaceae bacterium]
MFAWLKNVRPVRGAARDRLAEPPELSSAIEPDPQDSDDDLDADARPMFGLRQSHFLASGASSASDTLQPDHAGMTAKSAAKPAGHPPWLAGAAAITLLVISGSWIVMGAFKDKGPATATPTRAASKPGHAQPGSSAQSTAKADTQTAKFSGRLTEAQPKYPPKSTPTSGSKPAAPAQPPRVKIINTAKNTASATPAPALSDAVAMAPNAVSPGVPRASSTHRSAASQSAHRQAGIKSAEPLSALAGGGALPGQHVGQVHCVAGCAEGSRDAVVYSGEMLPLASAADTGAQTGSDATEAAISSASNIQCAAGCYSGPRGYPMAVRPLQTPQEELVSREGGGSITIRRGVKGRKIGIN